MYMHVFSIKTLFFICLMSFLFCCSFRSKHANSGIVLFKNRLLSNDLKNFPFPRKSLH